MGRGGTRPYRKTRSSVTPHPIIKNNHPMVTDMKIESKTFRVGEGEKVKLKKWPTKTKPFYKSKEEYKTILETHIRELSARQSLLYADNRHSLLLIFQAMDAAGKDGAIKHVMSGINPQGCQVFR